MPLPQYLTSLTRSTVTLNTSDGRPIEVWELNVSPTAPCLPEWASHFRQHYCLDSEIEALRDGTGLSRKDFLIQIIFPDKSAGFGPGIRSGDFAEVLVSDYVEYRLGYWVPRDKYAEKASRDESVKGVDIIGIIISSTGPPTTDRLLAFEVKAQLTGNHYDGKLQDAVNDSSKDYLKRAITLSATKRRLLRAGQDAKALQIQRFQNPSDHPYIYQSGAAAVLSDSAYDAALIQSSTSVAGHQNASNLGLIVIRGSDLMTLVHALYERAADEA
jgi:hypothetical protein